MTSSWDAQFNQLQAQFFGKSKERLALLESHLESLASDSTNHDLLRQIMHHFHWLAGSGGTYGLEDVSQWGNYGEELCDYLLKVGGPVGGDHLEKLVNAVTTIRQLFAIRQEPRHSGNTGEAPAALSDQASSGSHRLEVSSQTDSGSYRTQAGQPGPQDQAPPRQSRENPSTASSPPPPGYGSAEDTRPFAVVVDGDLTNLGLLKHQLEAQGFAVESLSTGSAAMMSLSERLPDALIITVPLPDTLGYELAQQLRASEGGERSIIVILGQHAGFLDKVEAIRAGADAFFDYPTDYSEISARLAYLLDRDKAGQYKVLSVEDDPDQAAFIKITLEAAGYQLLQIDDPRYFEEAFLAFEPDLVLLDVVLGDIEGYDLAKYIRQQDRFANTPIIFLTTQNKLKAHIKSAKVGGDDHLVKPVAPQLLIATIAGRLEKARALKRLIDRDGLTRCLTYGTFMEKLTKLIVSDGTKSSPAMMLIDVDDMHHVNSQYGFAAGDRVLTNIGSLLLRGFRNTDLICRLGHNRFAVIIEHLNEDQLLNLATQVLNAIAATPHTVSSGVIGVTCSAGVALLAPGMDLKRWLQAAEQALDAAKGQGKNRAIVSPAVGAAR